MSINIIDKTPKAEGIVISHLQRGKIYRCIESPADGFYKNSLLYAFNVNGFIGNWMGGTSLDGYVLETAFSLEELRNFRFVEVDATITIGG